MQHCHLRHMNTLTESFTLAELTFLRIMLSREVFMEYFDYHVHSSFSPDCKVPMSQQAQAALEAGLSELCFCDHHELHIPDVFGGNCEMLLPENIKSRNDTLRRAREEFTGRLVLRCGSELGEPWYSPKKANEFIEANNFDFVLASNHGLDNGRDFYIYHPEDATADGLINEFFDLWLEKFDGFDNFDCVSHLTYPLRSIVPAYGQPDMERLRPKIEALLARIIKKGKGIEVNTSAFRHGFNAPYPDWELLALYHSLGGEIITVGSDAHLPRQVGYQVEETYRHLSQIGFRWVATFTNRLPTMHPLY